MPNPFDQFDEPGTTATATANPFDQFDTAPQADPRAARRADLQAQQAAARSAGETTSFSARAAAGIEQGLRTPEAMVRGGLDALQYYRALDAVTGSGDRFQRQNEAELRAMRDRDAFLARETQAIEGRDGRNFVGDLVQGVARGVVELPPQLMAGAAGAMRGAAVQASAAMGGLQGGLSQFAQERGEGRSQLEALPPAVASGLITAVTTRAFGDTGIESVFRNEGTQGFRRRLLGVLKDAGMEGAEEFVDQAQQDLLERVTRNPGKPLGESFYDTMQALGVGTVIGGAATAPRLIQRGNRPVIVNEQTGTTDFPPLEGDELPPPPPPAPPAVPANVPPPIRGEAAMETRPSASWTPDGPWTPAVDPELADAIAAIRAGYNPEVEAPAPAPAAPSTFNLQPSTLPDVPGVPAPLEGQPYDTALRTRPEATMETRPAAPLGLQREPTVSPELADAIAAVRGGYNPEVEAQVSPTPTLNPNPAPTSPDQSGGPTELTPPAKADAAMSPMMQQYKSIKSQLPEGTLLAFRLGDFYEFFFEDAGQAAETLQVALTKRRDVPMAGIPYHMARSSFEKLVGSGYKVAVVDQVGEAKPGKPVERKVTEVISASQPTAPTKLTPPAAQQTEVERKILSELGERPPFDGVNSKGLTYDKWRWEAQGIREDNSPAPTPSAVDSAIAALEAAKVKPGGLYALPDLGLTVTLWNGTLTAAQVALRAGRTLAQAVQAGVDWLRAQGQAFDEAEVRKALEQGLLQAPGIREHVGKRLLQEDFSPAAKAALEPLLRYEVKPDAQLFAEAAAVVEAIGPMEAEANYFGNPWGLPADAHVVLGFAIGNGLSTLEAQARAAGDTALADRIGRQNAEFQSQFVLQSTETARTLRAYRYFDLVGNLSPFTADLFARKVIERASQKQKQRIKPALDKGPEGEPGLTDRLNEINRAGINEAARTPEVQGAARTAINQAIEEEARTAGTPVQQAIAAEVVAQLQTAGRLNAVEAAIVREHFGQNPEPLALADKLERAGVKPAKARAAELEGKYKDGVEAFRAKLRQKLAEARKKDIDPATLGIVDKAIRQRLAELQVKLGALVRQHWTEQERVGRTLADLLVQEAGLPEAQATRLADAIQRRFKALVQARKEQALRNLAKTPAARELQKPSVAQRIIEATNLGALDSEGLWQAVADKLGLPTYSAEASAEVKRLADRAQQLPEGSVQRQEATARLMRFIARQKNVNLGDLGWAFWYANTLSGPITHAVNAFSNVLSLAGNVSTQFRDVRGIPQILAATAKGFRTGLTEARAIVKQGPGANRTKFTEQGQALENLDPQDFTGAGLVSQWRYVARALAASDAAFYFPAREAKAITLARALARQEGKTGAAIRTRAQQILDGTEEQQNLWGAQVDRERAQLVAMGEKPDALWTTRRLEQLREQGWGADIGEAADDFALRTTYNNRPYGLIGTLADVAKFAQNRVPGARGVVPFVNVVANVVNDSINYTPWGFARAYAAGRTGEPSVTLSLPFEWAEKLREGKSPMTPDAVVDLHAKAALGTAMFGSLMAMALANLDDDDGENYQLYGSGPKDAAAKAALRETGWLPYSVRVNGTYVSFANTPLAIPLGALGHYLDAARYDKRFEQADAFNRLGVALWGGAHIITQQSFLDGLARLLGALEERRGRIDTASDRAVEQAFRSISSVAVPNALRQLDRLNDPKIYDTRGIEGALVAAIPFARRAGSPALNAFGEPITNEPWKRFASDAEANVWADLARRKIYPSVADKAKNAAGREMTDDEHYRYVQESGQAIKRRLETPGMRQMIRSGKEEDARKAVTAIVREERERARRRLGF